MTSSDHQRSGATLKDVAARAGVSLATASRTLNGQQALVRDELRERVLAASRELGYVPNAQAQALARATTSTVGLIVHDIDDPYFSAIAQGAIAAATELDLLVVICSAHRDPEKELRYMSVLGAQRVRAVVLAGSGFETRTARDASRAQVEALRAVGIQVACVSDHGIAMDSVLPDNRGGAAAVTRMLLEHGHREFGVVAGPAGLTTSKHRVDGVRQALEAGGIGLAPERVVDGLFTRDGGRAAALDLLRRAPEVTALVALTDVMAVGALSGLAEAGLRVPEDVSVTGFDDIQLAEDVRPALTTVRVPMAQLGECAVRLAIDGRPNSRPRRVPFATEVVARASTAPPRQ